MDGFKTGVVKIGDPRWTRFVVYRADRMFWTGSTWDENWRKAILFSAEMEACQELLTARQTQTEWEGED